MVAHLQRISFLGRVASLGGFLVVSTVLLNPGIAIAQTGSDSVNPLSDFQTRDNYDPFSGGGGGVTPGFFDLIHRASQGFDFNNNSSEQGQALDAAALEFRNQQKKQLNTNANQTLVPDQPQVQPEPAPIVPETP